MPLTILLNLFILFLLVDINISVYLCCTLIIININIYIMIHILYSIADHFLYQDSFLIVKILLSLI